MRALGEGTLCLVVSQGSRLMKAPTYVNLRVASLGDGHIAKHILALKASAQKRHESPAKAGLPMTSKRRGYSSPTMSPQAEMQIPMGSSPPPHLSQASSCDGQGPMTVVHLLL